MSSTGFSSTATTPGSATCPLEPSELRQLSKLRETLHALHRIAFIVEIQLKLVSEERVEQSPEFFTMLAWLAERRISQGSIGGQMDRFLYSQDRANSMISGRALIHTAALEIHLWEQGPPEGRSSFSWSVTRATEFTLPNSPPSFPKFTKCILKIWQELHWLDYVCRKTPPKWSSSTEPATADELLHDWAWGQHSQMLRRLSGSVEMLRGSFPMTESDVTVFIASNNDLPLRVPSTIERRAGMFNTVLDLRQAFKDENAVSAEQELGKKSVFHPRQRLWRGDLMVD